MRHRAGTPAPRRPRRRAASTRLGAVCSSTCVRACVCSLVSRLGFFYFVALLCRVACRASCERRCVCVCACEYACACACVCASVRVSNNGVRAVYGVAFTRRCVAPANISNAIVEMFPSPCYCRRRCCDYGVCVACVFTRGGGCQIGLLVDLFKHLTSYVVAHATNVRARRLRLLLFSVSLFCNEPD